jgi:hypothetical protein
VDVIVIEPGGGEPVGRGERNHRILVELPELEVIELRFGPDFEGVDGHTHADHVDSFFVLEGEVPGRMSPLRSAPSTGSATPATASCACSTSTPRTRVSAFGCVTSDGF